MEFVLTVNKRQKKKIIIPNTPEQDLFLALETKNDYQVQRLISSEIDLTNTVNGWTLLTAACEYGHERAVEVLILKLKDLVGNQRDKFHIQSVLDAFNDNGDTPLICAARAGHVNVCSQLLEAGAYINQTNQYVRQTPLLVAIEHGHTDVVEYLLDCGADIQITDNISITPLYVAIKTRNAAVVRRLIDAGCDVNLGSQDHTPLFLAARLNQLNVVQMLCDAGCQKDITIKYDVTALYEATFRGHAEIVEYLINQACDVNKTDMYGVSPLHVAAMNGHVDCVKLLVIAGGDMRLRMQHGQTALQVAMEMNRADVVEFFLKRGEDILQKPHGNNSLKVIACLFEKGHIETIEVLLRGCSKLVLLHYPGVTQIFCNHKNLLQMLFLSGHQTIPGVLTVPKLHPRYIKDTDISDWLEDFHRNPKSLKSLARIRIRRCLGNRILCYVNSLPLPIILKDYVCLNQL